LDIGEHYRDLAGLANPCLVTSGTIGWNRVCNRREDFPMGGDASERRLLRLEWNMARWNRMAEWLRGEAAKGGKTGRQAAEMLADLLHALDGAPVRHGPRVLPRVLPPNSA
jgi:ABC-type phosphonate transport system ATPase subunit